jgi:Protein of unknown function (DUF2587)
MTDNTSPVDSSDTHSEGQRTVVVGADGMAVEVDDKSEVAGEDRSLTDLVDQPAKVMRIGSMIKQLLEEVRGSSLDEASRARLKLIEELERISLPFADDTVPSESELRVAQAQLVGWLEGLFHGIQTALFAQQMAARAQFEEMRRRALPPGMSMPEGAGQGPGQAQPGQGPGARGTGQYL